MGTEAILARVEGVRKTAPDRWIARCPAHEDRSPSLAIRSLSDGRTLIHCHALCATSDVLDAIGLPMTALFEERALRPGAPIDRTLHDARDALRCLTFEVVFLGIVANDLAGGRALADEDRQRLRLAMARIARAQEICNA